MGHHRDTINKAIIAGQEKSMLRMTLALERQQAEIERLRAALKPLLDHYLNCYDGIEDQIAKDANAALNEQTSVKESGNG